LRPRLLDLFCGAGGCAMGYHRAGFDVVGVDHEPQPRYPFAWFQQDALEALRNIGQDFDVIHASPPCQGYSRARNIQNARGVAQDLVGPVRELLARSGKPWVIENVVGAPLSAWSAVLCGTQFGLRLRRHRLFEASILLWANPQPCNHRPGDITVFGHMVELCNSGKVVYKSGDGAQRRRRQRAPFALGKEAMGIDWMNRAELSQAIPPAYTEWVGRQLLAALGRE
jgi:DNA (cytosine-5)-methyltransferase 1